MTAIIEQKVIINQIILYNNNTHSYFGIFTENAWL